MATFVKLTSAHNHRRPKWINLGLVRLMERVGPRAESTFSSAMPERTVLWFDGSGGSSEYWDREEVLETPDEILSLVDVFAPEKGGA